MRSLRLARGRALNGCACAAIVAALAGCSSRAANSGSSVAGNNLTVYVSKPAGTLTAEQQDVLDAEQLALRQIGNRVGKYTVRPVQTGGNELSDNARGAIADPTTIAYLGELQPGASGQTIGITNAQDVVQVSPTDNAVELTQAVSGVSGSPNVYYESLSTNGRTFARVVPTDRLEAKALVGEMQTLGVKSLYIKIDASAYGAALSGLVIHDAAPGITIASSPSGADAILYAGTSVSSAVATFDQAASGGRKVKLFAPSALAGSAFSGGLSPAAQVDAYVSSPGYMSTDMPSQTSQFAAAFKAAYGHPPATEAVFGYEAMALVLAALHRAGSSANSHSTVVKDLLGISRNSGWPGSAVGRYSIDKNGDVNYAGGAPFVFSRIRAGKLVPFKAVQQQG